MKIAADTVGAGTTQAYKAKKIKKEDPASAVAFYRLFGGYGHTLTIEPHEGLLGSHRAEELVFHGVGELTAEQRLTTISTDCEEKRDPRQDAT